MKNKKKLKEYETVWTCDFCGEEFKTKKESDKHELVCDKNPDSVIFPLNRSIKKSWLVLWLTTMIVFGITVFINSNLFPQGLNLFDKKWFLNLFFINIIFGIVAFFGMVFTENKNRKKIIPVVKYSFIICLFYCLFNVGAVFSVKNTFQEQKQKSDYLKHQTPTNIPLNLTPTQTVEMVNCSIHKDCGGGTKLLEKSICDNSTCCQINGKGWIFYQSKSACIRDQNIANNNPTIDCTGPDGVVFKTTKTECDKFNSAWGKNNTSNQPTSIPRTNNYNYPTIKQYPPCTIYYPVLKYSQTYYHTSPEDCQKWRDQANSISSPNLLPTSVPTQIPTAYPTTDPSLCNQAVVMWNEYKADFYATRYNDYSSSAEAIMALEAERQVVQNEIYSYGCSNIISL